MEERILGIEDTIEKMNISVKENVKPKKKSPNKKYKKIQDTKKRQNLRLIEIQEGKEFYLKGPENISTKSQKKNFLT